ncbi:MAG: hypothetical protein HKN70_07160, partial [Gammaproteobacteria bacterium]|nr:hypothetical protein [Gammaproteobacteria bacterium]
TYTHANAAGDLRIDEQGIDAEASSGAVAGGNNMTTRYSAGASRDTMLYQSRGKAMVSVEGNVCRRMTADSAPPPGMPSGRDAKQMNDQMAAAMSQANAAMEEALRQARKQGMTPEQERAMAQWTQPLMNAQSPQQKREVQIRKLNDSISVAGFKGDGYEVTDEKGRLHRVWLAPASKVPGGRQVRAGLENMYNVFAAYMENMGGAGLVDRGMFTVFMKGEFANMYPIQTENSDSGEITRIVKADAGDSSADFYPECEVRDMFDR